MTDRAYTAVAYITTTGQVVDEIDLAEDPTWDIRLNDAGSWSVKTALGQSDDRDDRVFGWCFPWLVSVAIMWGDVVCQAGPIVSYSPDQKSPLFTVQGKGLWAALNRRVLHAQAWNPATTPITDVAADLSVMDSLPNIARTIVSTCTSYTNRAGSTLPIDLPTATTVGTNERTYHGYEKATAGQRLQELTQVDNGPDVVFAPYIAAGGSGRVVRHRMLIGTPYLTPPGNPMLFDFGSSLVTLAITGDGSKLTTTSFVNGAGTEYAQVVGYATDTDFTGAGGPMLDDIDGSHASATEQETLDSWAAANIGLNSKHTEQWTAVVRADTDPRWGSYLPGHYANYTTGASLWPRSGMYEHRILAVSNGPDRGTVSHQLEAVRT